MKKVNKINRLDIGLQIRKWYTQIEDTLANESGVAADGAPLRKIVIACAVHNPYAMQPGQRGKLSRKLSAIVKPSLALGAEFGRRIQAQMQAMLENTPSMTITDTGSKVTRPITPTITTILKGSKASSAINTNGVTKAISKSTILIHCV